MTGPVDAAAAALVSLKVGLACAVLGLPFALGFGWLLARRRFPGQTALSTVLMAPLVIPPIVTGFLLLRVFGATRPVGSFLAGLGLPVPFTTTGAVLAALVVGLPLYIIAVRNAIESVDPRLEEAAMTLGLSPWSAFRRVTLPLALPGVAAGALLAFSRALGEFGATIVLAGNVEGSTRSIALAVYTLLEAPHGERQLAWLVGASVALSFAALWGFETLSLRQRRRLERL
ncbi:MAG: molybdate ABC transporter permease subunit [Elusimicrobia bacterium]|nr:molybdate ABC transporter permease subunit [Elusimicrobiota bacterium]